MAINRFPYQDDILRQLSGGSASVSEIATAIAGEGRHSAEGHDSDKLHRSVAENVDHLVHLGLVEYSGSGADRAAALTTAEAKPSARCHSQRGGGAPGGVATTPRAAR